MRMNVKCCLGNITYWSTDEFEQFEYEIIPFESNVFMCFMWDAFECITQWITFESKNLIQKLLFFVISFGYFCIKRASEARVRHDRSHVEMRESETNFMHIS